MMPLLSLLERESRRRTVVAADEPLTVATCFTLIRGMPYRRASTRQLEAIIREWQGTCSGKHYALNQLFGELGLHSRIIMCTHRFTRDNTSHFLSELRALVEHEPVRMCTPTPRWRSTAARWRLTPTGPSIDASRPERP